MISQLVKSTGKYSPRQSSESYLFLSSLSGWASHKQWLSNYQRKGLHPQIQKALDRKSEA